LARRGIDLVYGGGGRVGLMGRAGRLLALGTWRPRVVGGDAGGPVSPVEVGPHPGLTELQRGPRRCHETQSSSCTTWPMRSYALPGGAWGTPGRNWPRSPTWSQLGLHARAHSSSSTSTASGNLSPASARPGWSAPGSSQARPKRNLSSTPGSAEETPRRSLASRRGRPPWRSGSPARRAMDVIWAGCCFGRASAWSGPGGDDPRGSEVGQGGSTLVARGPRPLGPRSKLCRIEVAPGLPTPPRSASPRTSSSLGRVGEDLLESLVAGGKPPEVLGRGRRLPPAVQAG